MFSLIISIVAVGLTVAMLSVTAYAGGDYLTHGRNAATASGLVTQGQELLGFATMYHQDPAGADLTSIDDLVAKKYLAESPTLSLNNGTGTWSMPVSGKDVFVFSQNSDASVCSVVNQRVRGDSNILAQVTLAQPVQCFGTGPYTVVAGTPSGLAAYSKSLGVDTIPAQTNDADKSYKVQLNMDLVDSPFGWVDTRVWFTDGTPGGAAKLWGFVTMPAFGHMDIGPDISLQGETNFPDGGEPTRKFVIFKRDYSPLGYLTAATEHLITFEELSGENAGQGFSIFLRANGNANDHTWCITMDPTTQQGVGFPGTC